MIEAAETIGGFVAARHRDVLWRTAVEEIPALLPLLRTLAADA